MFEHQLIVGGVYRFVFKPEFERHGVCTSGGTTCLHRGNGIFKIEQISTLRDIVLAGVDLYGNFFKPLGITTDEFEAYFNGKPADTFEKTYVAREVQTQSTTTENRYDATSNSVTEVQRTEIGKHIELVESGISRTKRQYFEELIYGSFPIYKLVDVVNPDDILYAPEKAIKNMPEVSLYEYQNLSLAVDIGYFDNPENLDGLLYTLRESLALYGIQPTNIQMLSADSRWMNAEEYEECKSIRVPGTLVKITEQNKEGYAGRIAIIDGKLKQIVMSGADDDEVNISDLISKPQVIDPRLLLKRVPLSERAFDSSKQYYLTGAGYGDGNYVYIKLVEGHDYAPGEDIPHYVKTSDTTVVADKTYYYADSNGEYAPIDASSPENNVVAARNRINAGGTVYRYSEETIIVGDKPPESTSGYVQVDLAYVENTNNKDLYFVKIADVAYLPATIHDQTIDPSASGLFETQPVFIADYSADAAVSLLTKRFKYENKFNMITEVELSPEVLANLILDESAPVMIANALIRRKYDNRWFEFTRLKKVPQGTIARDNEYYVQQSDDPNAAIFAYLDSDGKHKLDGFKTDPNIAEGSVINDSVHYREETVCVIINQNTFADSADMAKKVKGVICGEYGESHKDVVVRDDSLSKNFYALYMAQLAESARIAEENVRLKELIAKMSTNQG